MQPEAFADVLAVCVKQALAPLAARVAVLEALTPALTEVLKDAVTIHDRLALLEGRPPVPGPPGPPGAPGADGTDGQDGTPGLAYKGVFVIGKTYTPGDVVTWAGSGWYCHTETSSRPGDGASGWQLFVKCGRDGKDAKG